MTCGPALLVCLFCSVLFSCLSVSSVSQRAPPQVKSRQGKTSPARQAETVCRSIPLCCYTTTRLLLAASHCPARSHLSAIITTAAAPCPRLPPSLLSLNFQLLYRYHYHQHHHRNSPALTFSLSLALCTPPSTLPTDFPSISLHHQLRAAFILSFILTHPRAGHLTPLFTKTSTTLTLA